MTIEYNKLLEFLKQVKSNNKFYNNVDRPCKLEFSDEAKGTLANNSW